jgi:hypothetical protein
MDGCLYIILYVQYGYNHTDIWFTTYIYNVTYKWPISTFKFLHAAIYRKKKQSTEAIVWFNISSITFTDNANHI